MVSIERSWDIKKSCVRRYACRRQSTGNLVPQKKGYILEYQRRRRILSTSVLLEKYDGAIQYTTFKTHDRDGNSSHFGGSYLIRITHMNLQTRRPLPLMKEDVNWQVGMESATVYCERSRRRRKKQELRKHGSKTGSTTSKD